MSPSPSHVTHFDLGRTADRPLPSQKRLNRARSVKGKAKPAATKGAFGNSKPRK